MGKLIKKICAMSLLALSCGGMITQLTSCDSASTTGEKGEKGDAGTDGKDGTSLLTGHGVPPSNLGKTGDSYIDLDTFDYYVKEENGWALRGNIKGNSGSNGDMGKSAYQIWLEAGHTGSIEDFLNWLKGSSQTSDDENPQGLDFYPLDDGTYAVSVGKAKYLSKIEIPEKYNGKNVTRIINNGFTDSAVIDLSIPSTITMIDTSSFAGCKISKLSINANIISKSFFSTYFNSDYLRELTIGDKVLTVEKEAFSNCERLTTLSLSGNTTLGTKSFFDCDALSTIYYDGSLSDWVSSKVGASVFDRPNFNIGFENLYLSDSSGNVTYDGKQYKKIEGELTLYDGITSISSGAFYSIKHITSLVISDSVISIGNYAFCNASDLETVKIGDGVKAIYESAFASCFKLSSVTLGNNLESIEMDAFLSCVNLTTITIPASVTNISGSAFEECYSLAEVINLSSLNIVKGSDENGGVAENAIIVKKSGESGIKKVGDYLFLKSNLGTMNLIKYLGNDSEITLPASLDENLYVINQYAFYENETIKKVTIPLDVASIGAYSFAYCSSLENVIIGNSVTEIGNSAFYYCKKLVTGTIGSSVIRIDDYAFYGTNLIEVINLSSLSITELSTENGYVGYYAVVIKTSGASEMVVCNDCALLEVEGVNFLVKYVGNDTQITLPNDFNGKTYQIYEKAFYGNETITSIVFPKNVTSVGSYAFYKCSNLKYVYFLGGISDEWDDVTLYKYNNPLELATICYYSENKPTSSSSTKYWHYIDGVVTQW